MLGHDIVSKWIGEAEKSLSKAFEIAKDNAPCIMFIDEIGRIAYRYTFISDLPFTLLRFAGT